MKAIHFCRTGTMYLKALLLECAIAIEQHDDMLGVGVQDQTLLQKKWEIIEHCTAACGD